MSPSSEHSRSRLSSRSRPRASRSTTNSETLPTDPASIMLGEGSITEQSTELLHDFVHPHSHHAQEETLIDEEDEVEVELKARSSLPWWKRPSPVWVLAMMPLSSIAFSSTVAPRVEIYTQLACAVHNPEIFNDQDTQILASKGFSTSFLQDEHSTTTSYHNATLDFVLGDNETDGPAAKPNCASDPAVQAAVAKLAATMTATMGLLGCLTTAWWGSYSDRVGRTAILGISVVGLLLTDCVFLLVYSYYQSLPGGYWFLIIGPVVEGALGGMSSAVAAMHAYLADTSTSATRSRIFSLNLGLLFVGMGIGPTLGSVLIHFTGQILSVFYLTTVVHTLYALSVWFIVPESLTKAQRRQSKVKHEEAKSVGHEGRRSLSFWVNRVFPFITPLGVIMPQISASANPLKAKRDWNLTLVAISYGLMMTLIGSYTYKFQYVASALGWSSENIGYWLSLVGLTRALFLAVVLPVIIKYFKSKPVESTAPESQPLISGDGVDNDHALVSDSADHSPARSFHFVKHSSGFDLGLAQVSLVLDLISYMLMGLSQSPIPFVIASTIGSLGSGFTPSVQSVALELYTQRGGTESGKLFGCLSVLQALCSQIIGPSMYGFIYVKTVSVLPAAIFYVGGISVALSFVALACVRLPHPEHHPGRGEDVEDVQGTSRSIVRETTLVDVEDGRDTSSNNKISPLNA